MPSEALDLISAGQGDEKGLLCCVVSLQYCNEKVKFRGSRAFLTFLIIPAYSQLWKGRKAVAQ